MLITILIYFIKFNYTHNFLLNLFQLLIFKYYLILSKSIFNNNCIYPQWQYFFQLNSSTVMKMTF